VSITCENQGCLDLTLLISKAGKSEQEIGHEYQDICVETMMIQLNNLVLDHQLYFKDMLEVRGDLGACRESQDLDVQI